MSRLGDILTDDTLDPPVHAVVLWNANPVVSVPNAEAIRRGLARDDLFTVVHEQFLTDTARYADIVLPATTQIEQDDVVPAWGHLWMGWNGKAIEPLGESCSNTELFRRLARAMGYTEPSLFDDDETLLAQALGGSVDLDELKASSWVRVPYPDDGRPFGSGEFPTASGKVELVSDCSAVDRPAGAADVRPRPGRTRRRRRCSLRTRSSWSPPSTTPASSIAATRRCRSTVPPRARRSSRSPPPMPQPVGSPTVTHAEVFNDRAAVVLPVRVSERVRPGVVADPVGLVGDTASRRSRRQRPDQRHAHRLGRWRRLLRHPRRGPPAGVGYGVQVATESATSLGGWPGS